MSETGRYAAFGPGYSGTTDDLNEAKTWVDNANGEGAIYLRLDHSIWLLVDTDTEHGWGRYDGIFAQWRPDNGKETTA